MLMMLALALMLLLDAFEVVAYSATNNVHADEKMQKIDCHRYGAYVVVLMPSLSPLPRHMMLLMMQG
jgi:hypothetical protein